MYIATIQRADSTDGMQHSRATSPCDPLPQRFRPQIEDFADLFTRPTWANALTLLTGAILAPGRRTVTAVLRILGRDREPDFCTFHRILSRAAWSPRNAARLLLHLLLNAFLPSNSPIVIGIDDTIERRWGRKIKGRAIYRDPVRSSKGHFVKVSGLRWLSAMLLVRVPWAGRIMALPFFTALAPSERFYTDQGRQPQSVVDRARQLALQICRWLPNRNIVFVLDGAFAAFGFLDAVRRHACIVTRLRLDAALFDFPPAKPKRRGRPPSRGKPQKKLEVLLKDRKVRWQRYRVSFWYGRSNRLVEIATGTSIWHRSGNPPVPIRWILVRDPKGEFEAQAFLATDLDARPIDILGWFVIRWQVEVTFEEVRRHLGVETQRQWSDKAIMRTTPILFGLFSIVTLWANDLYKSRTFQPRAAAWYPKATLTFSDAIAVVRREIWRHQLSSRSRSSRHSIEIPRQIWQRMENALAYAA